MSTKSSVFAGVIPNLDGVPPATVSEAFSRADTERGTSRKTFNLAELFTREELRYPELCVLELYTALATENTNGDLVSRAMVTVRSRPVVARSGEPYRGDPTTEAPAPATVKHVHSAATRDQHAMKDVCRCGAWQAWEDRGDPNMWVEVRNG